jgi:hypothetical protein
VISRWEHGKSEPSIAQVQVIEDVIGLPGELLRAAGITAADKCDVEGAVYAAQELDIESRKILLALYRRVAKRASRLASTQAKGVVR